MVLNAGGVLPESLGGGVRTLTLFQTKKYDLPYPIPDLTQNSIPYFKPAQELLRFV